MSGLSAEATLAQHAAEIKELRQGHTFIFNKLDELALEGKQVANTLGQISSALTELRVQKGPPWHQIISAASQAVLVIGAAISAVVYLASNGSSPAQHAIDKRATVLELKADLAKDAQRETQALLDYRLKRAEDDLKQLRAAFNWRPTITH